MKITPSYLARFIRKLILTGRKATGFFSLEGHQSAPDEPVQSITAKRAQHYGFVSECPDGSEIIVLAIGGGANNRVAVAEMVPGAPVIDVDGEVMLWTKHGQRVHLTKTGDVYVYPKAGQNVYLGADSSDATAFQKVVTKKELNDVLTLIQTHTHPETGATTGPSGTLASIAVDGSPNVLAKKP